MPSVETIESTRSAGVLCFANVAIATTTFCAHAQSPTPRPYGTSHTHELEPNLEKGPICVPQYKNNQPWNKLIKASRLDYAVPFADIIYKYSNDLYPGPQCFSHDTSLHMLPEFTSHEERLGLET